MNKNGIALVFVLGILALLMISGVSFSVLMRTERLASRNYVDVVKCRNYVHLALTRAMTEIDEEMVGEELYYPDPENDFFFRSVFVSAGDSPDPSEPDDYLGDEGDAGDYVPRVLRPEAAEAVRDIRWSPIYDPNEPDKRLGRYAYMAIDCGGFLDANIIAGEAREYGRDPGEILGPGAEADLSVIANAREGAWVRFETLPELEQVYSGDYLDQLFTYSRFPNQYYDPDAGEQGVGVDRVYIGGDPADDWDADHEARMKAVLHDVLAGANVEMFYNAMYDYADEGFVPRELEQFTTKPVPMINEVVLEIRGEIEAPDPLADPPELGSLTLSEAILSVETAYFFPQPEAGQNFVVKVEATLGEAEVPFSAADPPSFDPSTEDPYHVTKFLAEGFPMTIELQPGQVPVNVALKLDRVSVQLGGQEVDIVVNWPNDAFQFELMPGDIDEARSWEANDPRINWDASNETHWPHRGEGEHTLGAPNNSLDGNEDELEIMYCARAPFQSVGELTYLLYDEERPWQTLSIMDGGDDDNPRQLFDRFTAFRDDSVIFGLVNPNTPHDEVLESLFDGVATGGNPLDSGAGGDVTTSEFITYLNGLRAGGPILNRSDMVQRKRTGNDKFTEESILRNSIELIDSQQNMFTIILVAQALSDAGVVVSEQSAVAVVWRDPFPDETGRHLSFVRFFKWLTE